MTQQLGQTCTSGDRGDLVFGVRVDALPADEASRLAADGAFYPLTLDESGQLRVVLPGTQQVETQELAVLRELRDLMADAVALLRQIA